MIRRVIGRLGLALAVVAVLGAQAVPPTSAPPPSTSSASKPGPPPAPAPPPVLSELDRLKVINASQAVELWTLKLQQAASEVQKARGDFDRVVASVTPPGWQLNDKLELIKADK